MKRFCKNDGFTLVELMVTFLAGSIVMLSATTVLLLGIRIMSKSTDTAEKQYTTRVLLTAMEDIAAEGTITEVRNVTVDDEYAGWRVLNGTKVVFSFDVATNTVYTGAPESNAPLLDGIENSTVTLEGDILTFMVKPEGEAPYETSIYCRLIPDGPRTDTTGTSLVDRLNDADSGNDNIVAGAAGIATGARNAFLKALASQYGSRGVVMGANYDDAGKYYTELINSEWREGVAWCVCYISWALDQQGVLGYVDAPAEKAYVDKLEEEFKDTPQWLNKNQSEELTAGDLIFFNQDDDPEADHVGVVLAVQNDKVYTIEGNSYNRVRVRDYEVGASEIIGYGVLKWNVETQSGE